MRELIIDIILDSLKTVPFLYIAYFIIEFAEHKASDRFIFALKRGKAAGPLIGAALGCVPQCGFSVAAANLYSERLISVGTLIAVFLSTSDEAIPILLTRPEGIDFLWKIIILKLIIGAAIGMAVDFIFKSKGKKIKDTPASAFHPHALEKDSIALSALKHTLEIFIFIFAVNAVIGAAIYYIGEDKIAALMLSGSIMQPLLTALIGFIPNCAASVILAELFLSGGVSFGSLMSGLLTGAGIGLAVLFRTNKNYKENFFIIVIMYLCSSIIGVTIDLII